MRPSRGGVSSITGTGDRLLAVTGGRLLEIDTADGTVVSSGVDLLDGNGTHAGAAVQGHGREHGKEDDDDHHGLWQHVVALQS